MAARRFEQVAVLKGGPSSEREVSLRSGAAVAKGLTEAGYRVVEIDVTGRQIVLPDGIDAVFIALHGAYGEDGGVQAQLEALGVPYTGAGPEASRACFDKVESKRIFDAAGIRSPAYEVLRDGEPRRRPLPVVIKPSCQGSSIGVHRVMTEADWAPAVRDAFQYGDVLVVEEYIPGRELTVGVVDQEVLPVVEVVAPDDWYDYGAKYTKGKTEYRAPAPIPAETAARCQAAAWQTFEALGCRGLGRIDIRLAEDGTPYVLELNNIPGFTESSLLPKAAACVGISFSQLCARILETARCGVGC